jgi:hypothetical protein
MKERVPVLTGGCQCGAVRFASYSKPGRISVCHCRMLAWISHLHNLPGKTTAEAAGPAEAGSIVSYQHPDHNT